MKTAIIYKTIDKKYKDGEVVCVCGYKKTLGDGFNTYLIKNCPSCTPELETRIQRKVTYFDKVRRTLRADIGQNIYFVLSNGINIRYESNFITTHFGSEKKLNNL